MDERERERIAELVKEVQTNTAFGSVSSKYLCPEHNCFLVCDAVSIELQIGEKKYPYACDYRVLWRCNECNRTIVKVRED